jgi:hypothetical protein
MFSFEFGTLYEDDVVETVDNVVVDESIARIKSLVLLLIPLFFFLFLNKDKIDNFSIHLNLCF